MAQPSQASWGLAGRGALARRGALAKRGALSRRGALAWRGALARCGDLAKFKRSSKHFKALLVSHAVGKKLWKGI